MMTFTTLIVVCGIAQGGVELPAFDPSSPFVAVPAHGLFWNAQNCCGLVAAYHVLHQQGKPVDLDGISQSLTFGRKGTSLSDLGSLFQKHGLEVDARELDAAQLVEQLRRNPNASCIAHVEDDHWIVVEADQSGQLLCFEYPGWYSLPVERFSKTFNQKALFVSRQPVFKLAFSPMHLCLVVGVVSGCFLWRVRRNTRRVSEQ